MTNSNFQDLEVWKDGKILAVKIFKTWESIDNRGFLSLQDQMQRSATSIASNIAEGSERQSATEFMRYLYIAKASVAELRTQLHIFKELKIAQNIDVEKIIGETICLSKRISRLITAVSKNKPF